MEKEKQAKKERKKNKENEENGEHNHSTLLLAGAPQPISSASSSTTVRLLDSAAGTVLDSVPKAEQPPPHSEKLGNTVGSATAVAPVAANNK